MTIWKYTIIIDTEEPSKLEHDLDYLVSQGRGRVHFFRADSFKSIKEALTEWILGIGK
jgi:hypothetical protein